MAFWCRANQSKIRWLSHQFKRYYFQAPHASSFNCAAKHARHCLLENPSCNSCRRSTVFCDNVRFYGVPFPAKLKEEEVETDGPRLNNHIRAHVVRLVTEDGHSVISRNEALERAKKLGLDLVEVQRKADPPVCKIMDFHKEKYKQQLKEKDRTKSKSEVSLRKGDCKEVRFTEKIEAKDLKMKADTVIRLMERGYRVKCMAMGKGKEGEDEDLGGLLNRLTALIEDVAVVESGPRVERKQAYVLVRHVKFGPSKKGGAKKLKATGDSSVARKPTDSAADPELYEDDSAESGFETEEEILPDHPLPSPMHLQGRNVKGKNTAWSVLDSGDDFSKVLDLRDDIQGPHLSSANKGTLPVHGNVPSHGTGNRYQRSEPRNQCPPNMRESHRAEPQFAHQRQPPLHINASSPAGGAGADASTIRNSRLPPNQVQQAQPSSCDVPIAPASSYGIFSTPKSAAADIHGNREEKPLNPARNLGSAVSGASETFPGSKPGGSSQSMDGGQGRWGIFSGGSSNAIPNRTTKPN